MLVDGTNEYARSRIDEMSRTGKLKEKSRWRRWKDTTLDELKKVLAVVVNMGIIQVPELEMYWKTAWESNIPFFHDVLSRNRFEEIFWMLHLPLSTTATQTRLTKIKPFLEYLLVRFRGAFYPARELSVDETMIGFKGRVGFCQYCPMKPTKWGLKAFVLTDSATGMSLTLSHTQKVRQEHIFLTAELISPSRPRLWWLFLKNISIRVITSSLTGFMLVSRW